MVDVLMTGLMERVWAFSLLPDEDTASLLLMGKVRRSHNQTHCIPKPVHPASGTVGNKCQLIFTNHSVCTVLLLQHSEAEKTMKEDLLIQKHCVVGRIHVER